MNNQNFTIVLHVKQTPEQVFESIANVRAWWTESLVGNSQKLNDEFAVRFGDVHYSKQKLIEVILNRKIVWLVTDSKLNFLSDKSEWTNSRIEFEITTAGDQTQVRFTHVNLVPAIECYDACSNAWSEYINDSLYRLITTGKGQPHKEEATLTPKESL